MSDSTFSTREAAALAFRIAQQCHGRHFDVAEPTRTPQLRAPKLSALPEGRQCFSMALPGAAVGRTVRALCCSDVDGNWRQGYCSIAGDRVGTKRYNFRINHGGEIIILSDQETLMIKLLRATLAAIVVELGDAPDKIIKTMQSGGYADTIFGFQRLITDNTALDEAEVQFTNECDPHLVGRIGDLEMAPLVLKGAIATFLKARQL